MTLEPKIVSHVNSGTTISQKFSQWLGIVGLAIVLTACGGGGGSDSDSTTTSSNTPSNGGGTTTPPGGSTPPGGNTPPPPPAEPPVNDQQIFSTTVYPLMTGNNCVQCHSDPTPLGFPAIVPYMADEDVTTAYNQVVNNQKVNLNNPANSRLVLKPRDENHNCGGAQACEDFANQMQAAIQSWADAVAVANPPPSNMPRVASAMAGFADGQDGGFARVDDNVIAMYNFTTGSGNVVRDFSGVGTPLDLQISGDMEWVADGGLKNISGKAQASVTASRKLFDSFTNTNQFTVEAWVIPDNLDQTGPARIASYSINTARRNFTLGQRTVEYVSRVATNQTGQNGSNPELRSGDYITTELTHVAMTYNNVTGGREIYVNGQLVATEDLGQDALAWQDDNLFVLGNEVSNDRLWKGTFKMVALHSRALSAAEISQNHQAGLGNFITLAFDVTNVVGAPASIQMQVAELDDKSYVFANPTYVSDLTVIPIKNIRIAVNNSLPVATQAFRSVDTTIMDNGEQISPLGAVIPKDQGADLDVFHLEFEVLGAQVGMGDTEVPATEPGIADYGILPELGTRSFASVNDTMSALTGIPVSQNTVRNRYEELRDQLPASSDLLAFGAAQQIAIQRLATTYCDRVVNSNSACNAVFGSCGNIGGLADKQNRANALFDKFVGDLANQPDRADVTNQVVTLMDGLGCANGCSDATRRTALQASCAAVLASGATTIN